MTDADKPETKPAPQPTRYCCPYCGGSGRCRDGAAGEYECPACCGSGIDARADRE